MIRKLYIQNAAGARWGLNGDRGVYAYNLSGFGFTLSPNFADLSRGFFVPVSDQTEPQNTIPFTLAFTRNAYEVYQSFVNWMSSAGKVTLIYNPTGRQEYCRDVIVNFLQKGEKNAVGWLEVPASFFCSTPWYMPAPTVLDLGTAGEDESKRYDYAYEENLIYGDDSTASLSGDILGAGHIPGALELTYHGAITNPKIRLTGKNSGKTYGICSVSTVLETGDTLKFSSRYDDSYIKKISAGGSETDLLDVLDLSTTPFFHVPVDEACSVSIEADAAFTGSADLLIFYYYRSV